jgi:7-carboxy-7-deazaguanine synthase
MRCPGWPCDTPHAIEPALWKNDPKYDADILAAKIVEERYRTGAHRVCLTGGEPLMQDKDALRALIMHICEAELSIDIFSNGSFIYPEWLMKNPAVTIIMDWKLDGSGEADTKLEERFINLRQLRRQDCVKFVVTSYADLDEAHALWREWHYVRATPYVGAAWSHITDKQLVDYVMAHKLPWKLNVQLHKHIWGEVRGV